MGGGRSVRRFRAALGDYSCRPVDSKVRDSLIISLFHTLFHYSDHMEMIRMLTEIFTQSILVLIQEAS